MNFYGDIALLMEKERMEDAVLFAEQRRELGRERASRGPAWVWVGMALVRFGQWMSGEPSPES